MRNRTPSQADSLLDYLTRRERAETVELRRLLDIGNVSRQAARANARLAAVGDTRRVVCRHYGRRAVWVLDASPATAA